MAPLPFILPPSARIYSNCWSRCADRSVDLKRLLQAEWRATVAQAVASFAPREVIVRTLDIPRRLDEPMGNRGIRRCVGEGGGAIRVLCAALRDVLLERGGRIGLILPLASHYSQIHAAMQCALDSDLNLQRPRSTAPCQNDEREFSVARQILEAAT